MPIIIFEFNSISVGVIHIYCYYSEYTAEIIIAILVHVFFNGLIQVSLSSTPFFVILFQNVFLTCEFSDRKVP